MFEHNGCYFQLPHFQSVLYSSHLVVSCNLLGCLVTNPFHLASVQTIQNRSVFVDAHRFASIHKLGDSYGYCFFETVLFGSPVIFSQFRRLFAALVDSHADPHEASNSSHPILDSCDCSCCAGAVSRNGGLDCMPQGHGSGDGEGGNQADTLGMGHELS